MERKIYENLYADTKASRATIGFIDTEQTRKTAKAIIFLEFKAKPGDKIGKGESMISIEAMKGTLDIKSPLSGTVAEVNKGLEANPDILKSNPSEWLIRLDI